MKSNQVIGTRIDRAARTITFTVKGVGDAVLHLDKVHPDNMDYAALHGFKQRGGDAAAMGRNPLTGASASPQEKFANISRIVEHYESGSADWNLRKAGAVGNVAMLAEIIAERFGSDVADVREQLADMSAVEITALTQEPTIAAEITKRLAAKTANIDTSALMAKFTRPNVTSL